MPSLLRTRDLNVQQKVNVVSKLGASKHKSANDDEKDGPPRPKRVALSGITAALSTAIIDSSKKQLPVTPPKKEAGRLSPLFEEEQADVFEVDPAPGFDYDKENSSDPYAVSEFACDIFKYSKFREGTFHVKNYFKNQSEVDQKARAVLVDWIVQVQESFELNHETMYMAVKIMDLYIYKSEPHTLTKPILQLVSCVAIFIASKVEERLVPSISDLLYLCKRAYNDKQLKEMERDMLRVVGFDLGLPLSYSFLRRYSRVINGSMPLLTTARYYLEVSLHYLKFCSMSESRMAAACMLLALRVTKTGDWNPILEKYSGYKLADVEPLMFEVNHMVRQFSADYKDLTCVSEKYSHPVFFEVAKQRMLTDHIGGPVKH